MTASTDYLLARPDAGGQPQGTSGAGCDALRLVRRKPAPVRQRAFHFGDQRPNTSRGRSCLRPENTRNDNHGVLKVTWPVPAVLALSDDRQPEASSGT
jgi:hypothetical protein